MNFYCTLSSHPLFNFRNAFILSIFTFLWLAFPSCKTDEFKDFADATIKHEGAYAFSVGRVDFTLADILEDDTSLTVGADNGIKLVYRKDDFFSLQAGELLDDLTGDINESFTHSAKIGSVAIEDALQSSALVFSTMLDDFNDLNLANYIEQNNGSSIMIPAFEESVFTEDNVPLFSDYTTLTIEDGSLFFTVTNNLFFDIEDLSLEITDIGNNQSVGIFNFNYLSVGETKTSEIGLAGKTISNEFKVSMSTLKSPGTGFNFTTVDLDAKLDATFEIRAITINEGVVNLPAGVLAEDEISFDLTTNNDEQIKKIQLNDAQINYEITSDVATDILVKVTFPDVVRNNVPVSEEFTVSPTGTTGPVSGTLDFSNTLWSLDSDNAQPYNRFRANYEVSIPNGSNGQLAFSSEDAVNLEFTMSDLDVEEVVGYFGFQEEQFAENTFDLGFDFSLFADGSSPLLFSDPIMRIEISNSFGIPLQGQFNATAVGFFGENADLNPPKIIINHPNMSEMGQFANTVFVMNKNNSDLVEMLSVFPSHINYRGAAIINPNNDPNVLNFIRSDSRLDASVEFDLPFKFSAQNLIYRDTSDAASLGLGDGGFTIEDIDSAEMKIVYDNGLPLQSSISLIALDAEGNEAVVLENIQFEAASVDGNGRVPNNGTTHGETFILLTTDQLLTLDNADRYIYEVNMTSTNNGQTPVAMYSDYQVEMGLGIRLVVSKE